MLTNKEDRNIRDITELMNKAGCAISLYDMAKTAILVDMFNECDLCELASINEVRKRHAIAVEESELIDKGATIVAPSLSFRYVPEKRSTVTFMINRG